MAKKLIKVSALTAPVLGTGKGGDGKAGKTGRRGPFVVKGMKTPD